MPNKKSHDTDGNMVPGTSLINLLFEPLKPGDVPVTYASTDLLQEAVGFKPETTIEEGLQRFADWYVESNQKSHRGACPH